MVVHQRLEKATKYWLQVKNVIRHDVFSIEIGLRAKAFQCQGYFLRKSAQGASAVIAGHIIHTETADWITSLDPRV